MKVLISGGGTGGHIYPAIAIANKIKSENEDAQILFVGTKMGIESEIVPKNGYNIKTITVQGFQRKISLENAKRVMKLLKGLEEARSIVKKFKPDIVIGTGGYVCGPVVFNAAIRGIPTVIHEQNAFPGITNKILSKFVSKVLISFDEAKKYFKAKDKVIFTGNPVRREILIANKEAARRQLGIPEDKKMVLCVGGSGGSKKINDCMLPVLKNFVNDDIMFIYVTGKNYYDNFKDSANDLSLKGCQKIIPYLDDMATALAACDLVICSAGAITLAEVSALGKPSIVIPKAYTAENHQEYNAKCIEKQGAGIAILEKNLSFNKLNEAIYKILGDRKKLEEMSIKSKENAKIEAISNIYREIIELIK